MEGGRPSFNGIASVSNSRQSDCDSESVSPSFAQCHDEAGPKIVEENDNVQQRLRKQIQEDAQRIALLRRMQEATGDSLGSELADVILNDEDRELLNGESLLRDFGLLGFGESFDDLAQVEVENAELDSESEESESDSDPNHHDLVEMGERNAAIAGEEREDANNLVVGYQSRRKQDVSRTFCQLR